MFLTKKVHLYNYLNYSDIYDIIQIDYIKKMWLNYYIEKQYVIQNKQDLLNSFVKSLIKTAREDYLLFCVLLYKYIGMQELDVAWHIQVLTTICQLHSYNKLYLDEEETKKDLEGKKHYKRDDTKPLLKYGDYIISIPPGHGKTTICSVLYSAWLLGKYSNLRILFATCSASGKAQRVKQVHLIMDNIIYKEIFGEVLKKNCGITQVECKKGGYVRGTTTNIVKAITGDDADMLIIDDANNSVNTTQIATKNVNDWYQLSAKPRVRDGINKMPTLIIQQRVDDKDLTGFLLKDKDKIHINHFNIKAKVDDDEDFIIKTINQGDIVFKRQKGFLYIPDEPKMREEKINSYKQAMLNEERWLTQYQQAPFKNNSNIFKLDYFNFYETDIDLLEIDYTFITTDLSWLNGITNDYCCFCWWGIHIEEQIDKVIKKMYLLDIIWNKFPQEDKRADLIIDFFNKNANKTFLNTFEMSVNVPFAALYIENVSQNLSIIPELDSYFGSDCIYKIKRNGSKLSRTKLAIQNIYTSQKQEGVMILLPKNNDLTDRMISECLEFDGDNKKHDDFCDNLTDALMYGSNIVI